MDSTSPSDPDPALAHRAAQRAVLRSYRRWAVGLAAPVIYWFSCVPHPVVLKTSNGRLLEILSVRQETRWSSGSGKQRYLAVALLTHEDGDRGVGAAVELMEVLPWAKQLAQQHGDTLVVIQQVQYPYSLFVPYRRWTETPLPVPASSR
jgi:hypothetical protein